MGSEAQSRREGRNLPACKDLCLSPQPGSRKGGSLYLGYCSHGMCCGWPCLGEQQITVSTKLKPPFLTTSSGAGW